MQLGLRGNRGIVDNIRVLAVCICAVEAECHLIGKAILQVPLHAKDIRIAHVVTYAAVCEFLPVDFECDADLLLQIRPLTKVHGPLRDEAPVQEQPLCTQIVRPNRVAVGEYAIDACDA